MVLRRSRKTSPDKRGACRPAERGEYVTDGTRLYRVIAPADPQLGFEDAVLEDCEALTWRIHTVAELWWIPMWRVSPTGRGRDLGPGQGADAGRLVEV